MLIPTQSFAFGKNKIVYEEFDWQIYHATHFDIYFYPEERDALQKVVNLAESAYDEISRKFNFQITEKIPLIYYATHSDFEQTNVILSFIPEGVGAFASTTKNRMVLPIDMSDEDLFSLIKHELTHIFQYEILFQGKFGREIRASPPTWFMEGLASYMAEDEDTADMMFLRDAVVNDSIPSVGNPFGGFFAYRFGHAVFRFIQEEWGMEGLRDFIYEYRNSLGSIERPIKRSFEMTIEEFDAKFRTWLRRQYLPTLVAKGEPLEYGERFVVKKGLFSQEISPALAPSGDLLVAMTTYKEDIDVGLFNVPERKLFRNLTKGYPSSYEFIIAQFLTTGPVMGRDLAFHPSGDRIGFFAKKERGRVLVVANALSGSIERSIKMNVEQQLNPAFSPDGSKVAFHAFSGNKADIWVYDLQRDTLENLTDDEFFDAAPVYSPDGKWLVYASVVDGHAKLFKLDLSNPSRRVQVTRGEWDDIDPYFSPDGKRLYFASDRPTGRTDDSEEAAKEPATADGADGGADEGMESGEPKSRGEWLARERERHNFAAHNIYSLDLESGEVRQFTDVIGGAFTPVAFTGDEGKETIVFSSYYKGNWRLYSTPADESLGIVETLTLTEEEATEDEERFPFLPPVEVALDESGFEDEGRFRLFIEDISVNAGVTSDQTFVSRSTIIMSDMLGNRRFVASLDSVSTFSNFDFLYLDLSSRLSWGFRLFDDRTFFIDFNDTGTNLDRRSVYRQTGLMGILSYPFDRNRRVDMGLGYMSRKYDIPSGFGLGSFQRDDDFPFVSATFSGDGTSFKQFGPVTGRRYNFSATYAPDLDGSGTLSSDLILDFRQYRQLTSRSGLAMRFFGGYSEGNFPNFYYFGGLNTLRGYDYRSLVGTRAFYANFEVRFPLIDYLVTPVLNFQDIRGNLFVDIGGAWFDGQDFKFWENSRLADGLASVGYGVSFRFWGLELHWDFAWRTDGKDILPDSDTSFWIGPTF